MLPREGQAVPILVHLIPPHHWAQPQMQRVPLRYSQRWMMSFSRSVADCVDERFQMRMMESERRPQLAQVRLRRVVAILLRPLVMILVQTQTLPMRRAYLTNGNRPTKDLRHVGEDSHAVPGR